jgi:hypothetical protein
MAKRTSNPIDDLQGAARIVIDATKGVTQLLSGVRST